MGFRADGTAVLRSFGGEDVGYAMAFTPDAARKIADALNTTQAEEDGRAWVDPLTGEAGSHAVAGSDQRPLSDVIGKDRYVKIVGPYATALMGTPDGRQVRSLAEGAVLPGDVTAATARHLISVGLAAVVEAKTPLEVFEAAPTERHRVEMTSTEVIGPTVGTPAPGSPAAQYDQDPIAAAQAAAEGRFATSGVVTQTTGAGLGLSGDATASTPDTSPAAAEPPADKPPHGNASRDTWAAWASEHGAPADETAPVDEGGLSRDELRTKYGS